MPKVSKKAETEEIETEVTTEESSEMLATRTTTKRATSYTQRSITSMFGKAAGGKGKSKASAASAPAEKVQPNSDAAETADEASAEKDAQPVASTSTSQIEIPIRVVLDTLEKDTMHPTWYNALKAEFSKPYFEALKKFLAAEHAAHTVFPAMENIYSWSRYTPLPNVKVVILGQDPYHDVNQAHGLSFSVLPPTKPPGSLRNIYKQLAEDFPGFVPPKDKGDLSAVASQGVLWLNTALTVRAHKAGSHSKKGWETFTTQVLKSVLHRKLGAEDDSAGEQREGVVFMAWGLPAQNNLAKLGIDKDKHLLLKSAHPSPLSANKGFLGNGHFRKANEWLVKKYGEDAAIDWTVLSAAKKK